MDDISLKNLRIAIAAGSYEGSIFGWKTITSVGDAQDNDSNMNTTQAELNFGFNCSKGSLRAIAVSANGE